MTLSLARNLGPEIRVNSVCPGFVQGRWLKEGLGEEAYEFRKNYLEQQSPLGVTATPETMAATVAVHKLIVYYLLLWLNNNNTTTRSSP